MSAADLSIVAMAVVSLTHIWTAHKHDMRIADRLRLVNPSKTPVQPKAEAAVQPDERLSVLGGQSKGEAA